MCKFGFSSTRYEKYNIVKHPPAKSVNNRTLKTMRNSVIGAQMDKNYLVPLLHIYVNSSCGVKHWSLIRDKD